MIFPISCIILDGSAWIPMSGFLFLFKSSFDLFTAIKVASLLIENPYPNLKSNGIPKVTTTSAFFKACFLLCLKKYLSEDPKQPLAIPEVNVGTESLSILFKHIGKNSLFCVTWLPKRKTGFFAFTIASAALSIFRWSNLNSFTGFTLIDDFFEENKSLRCLSTYQCAILPK